MSDDRHNGGFGFHADMRSWNDETDDWTIAYEASPCGVSTNSGQHADSLEPDKETDSKERK
jgi:hypothetical protein